MDNSIPQKTCTSCNQPFPATLKYFHAGKDYKYGVNSECKTCRAIKSKASRQTNHQHDLERKRIYRETHKKQVSEYKKEYTSIHLEDIHQKNKIYREQHKDEIKQAQKTYRMNNPEIYKARKHRRRARKMNNGGTYTSSDIKKQYDRQKGKCYYCSIKVGTTYHVDHVIPLAKGGSNNPENLVIACPHCNFTKSTKLWRLL